MSSQNITHTYGELLPPGITKLLSQIDLNENDIFLDLGSGKGKLVKEIFYQTQVKEAIGIEILPELQQPRLEKHENRSLQFVEGNFLEIPWPAATVIFICAQCFSQPMLKIISQRINLMTTLRAVVSLRPLPRLMHLSFKKYIQLECSWGTAMGFMYG